MNQRIAHLAVVLLLCMSVSTAARAELADPAPLPVPPSVPSVSSSSEAPVVEPADAAPRAATPAPPPVPTRTTRRSATRSRWVWPVVAGSITMAAGLLLIPIGVGIAFIPDEACKGQLDCVGKYVAPGIGTAVGGGGGLLLVGGIITGIGAIGLAATF